MYRHFSNLLFRSYNSAEPSDLYAALQAALDNSNVTLPNELNISNIMTKWDTLVGYPVIDVNIDYNAGSVTFKQVNVFVSAGF